MEIMFLLVIGVPFLIWVLVKAFTHLTKYDKAEQAAREGNWQPLLWLIANDPDCPDRLRHFSP